jgi:hypothetical protein
LRKRFRYQLRIAGCTEINNHTVASQWFASYLQFDGLLYHFY